MIQQLAHLDYQASVLAKLTVHQAKGWPEVISAPRFRTHQEAFAWIEDHREGPPPEYGRWPLLRFASAGRIREWKCSPESPAAQVSRLADRLANSFRWKDGHAARWVLTGQTPEVALYDVTVSLRPEWPRSGRISLTVDAALTPQDVAGIYQAARRDLVRQKKVRPVDWKNLAVLDLELTHPELSIRALMKKWNLLYPREIYTSPQNFHRDIQTTAQRLSMGALIRFP